MKDEARGAIVIVVGVTLYLSALYCRRSTEPQLFYGLDFRWASKEPGARE